MGSFVQFVTFWGRLGSLVRPGFRPTHHGHILASLGLSFLLFVALAQSMRWAPPPDSPAWQALAARPSYTPSPTSSQPHSSPLDLAILGDSRAHAGLSPAVLSMLGMPFLGKPLEAHNFAVDGTDSLHHASFLLHGLLRTSPPPRLVLWAVHPLGFSQKRTPNRLEQLHPADLDLLLHAGAPLELSLEVALNHLFEPYRRRAALSQASERSLKPIGLFAAHLQTHFLHLPFLPGRDPRKYLPLDHGYEPFVVVDWQARFARGIQDYCARYADARPAPWIWACTQAALHEAHQRGVLVVLIELPVAPWLRDHFASGTLHTGWRTALQHLAQQEHALWINDAAHFADNRAFGDPAHMHLEAAERYSADLMDRLAALPPVAHALHHSREPHAPKAPEVATQDHNASADPKATQASQP